MTIIELKAQNLGILKAVNIRAEGKNTLVISGRNGQGKSTVLNAIAYALGGKDAFKSVKKPIRNGQERAEIVVTTDKYIVTRWWTSDDNSYLKVTSPEGASYANPQALLDSLVGDLSFDPLEFARYKEADQRRELLELAGIDLDSLDARRKEAFDKRTEVNRKVKALKTQLDAMPDFSDLPELVDQSNLLAQLDEANHVNSLNQKADDKIANLESSTQDAIRRVTELKKQIASLEELIESNYKQIEAVNEWKKDNPEVDTSDIRAKLADLSRVERLHMERERFHTISEEYDGAVMQSDMFTKMIEDIDQEKIDLLANAKLPIDGLGVDDTGVVYNGMPFSQLSDAEKLKVSVAIAMAKNPTLRVIHIRNGSLLDRESMSMIESLAKDKDYQVWIERVEDNVGILIEDGEVHEREVAELS